MISSDPTKLDIDLQQPLACLVELEEEYLRVGQVRCDSLTKQTQLSAFYLLGLRSVSLLRGLRNLLTEETIDSHEVLRRGFLEVHSLQFEFRLKGSAAKVQRWFEGKSRSWSADYRKLQRYWQKDPSTGKGAGRIYGALSEVSHPTLDAAQNSTANVSIIRRANSNIQNLRDTLYFYRLDWAGSVQNQILLTVATHPDLIDVYANPSNLGECLAFRRDHASRIDSALDEAYARGR